MDQSDHEVIESIRRFNRSYTQRIGVLDDSFLGSGRPLGSSRLLFEIGPRGSTLLDLRRRLGLDSGYLSRLLRQLEADGLVAVSPDPADGRRRLVHLSARGGEAYDDLDRRSEQLAEGLIEQLTGRQRAELCEALAAADRLLRAATITFDTVDPRSDDALRSMEHYFAELQQRFPTGFEAGDTLVADAPGFRAPTGAFLVAHTDADPIACGGLQQVDDDTAEIKRMWVDPGWRGIGLGNRTLRHLEGLAADLGYHRIILDTNSTLTEAISMYERAGYHSIERYNDNPYALRWFEKTDIGSPAP